MRLLISLHLPFTLIMLTIMSGCMDKTNPFEVVGVGADERTGNRAGGVINNGPIPYPTLIQDEFF